MTQRIPLYIPPSASGCIVSQNGTNAWCLQFTGPIIIQGVPARSILFPAASVPATVSIIQFVGYNDIGKIGVSGLFIGNPSTGQRTGLHALDLETTGTNQAFPSSSTIENNYFATPSSGAGFSIFANNSAVNNPDGGFARTVIKDNLIGSGISLQQSGDSIKIDHNVFIMNGTNNTNPAILANLVSGAGNLQVINNNCSIDNSCLEVDCATTVHVQGNEFEHSNNTNAADPVIYLRGNVCFVTGGDVTDNQAQAIVGAGGTPLIVEFDKARGVYLDGNRIATPTNYIPVSITSNGDTNIIGAGNKFFTATTFVADSSSSTTYANAQHYVGHTLHASTCTAGSTCEFANDIAGAGAGNDSQIYFRAPLAGLFKKMDIFFGSPPGAGQTYTVTLRKNSTNTSMTCTISGGSNNSCGDIVDDVTVIQGDQWNFQVAVSGSATAAQDIQWFVEFDPSVQ